MVYRISLHIVVNNCLIPPYNEIDKHLVDILTNIFGAAGKRSP